MEENIVTRWSQRVDRPGWKNFAIAMGALSVALVFSLFSAAVAQEGRIWAAGTTAALALGLAGWVAVTIVPKLARRTSLRWLLYQVDYRLTREGVAYLGAILVLVLAAVNTGNNLLFMILACSLAGLIVSGILSRIVLTGVELKFELPEHIFAEQPVLAEMELTNHKQVLPSFSLRVVGETKKGNHAEKILTRPVFFPYIPRLTSARQKVELLFPRRGVYRQDAFGIRTRFPFGFFEKTREVPTEQQIVVYPRVSPAEQFFEVLPLLSGEMASFYRGRGHDLHSLREYQPSDGARFVDWKVSARVGTLMVREFSREDERRVAIVFDPFTAPEEGRSSALPGETGSGQFERAVSLAASIAWHFYEINSVIQFRTNRYATPMASASEVIYDALHELALIQPEPASTDGRFLDEMAKDQEVFKIILTSREQRSIPSALWFSSYFIFINQL